MLANELLIDAVTRVKEVTSNAVEGLSAAELEWRPGKDANSIAWLAWHLTRAEDSQIASLADEEQIWTAGKWQDKFGLPFDASVTGYSHTSDEVAAVKVAPELLLGYQAATCERAVKFLNQLTEKDYEKVIDTSYSPPVTVKVRLVSIIGDITQHAGQAAYVRGLVKSKR